VLVLESEQYLNTVYSLVIPLISRQSASKFYSAFNGRYFHDDVETILQAPAQTGISGSSSFIFPEASGEKSKSNSLIKFDKPLKGSLLSKSFYSVSEVMHTIFLSDIFMLNDDFEAYDINYEYQRAVRMQQQNMLMENLYFEQLPTCPLCLERIDSSMSGL